MTAKVTVTFTIDDFGEFVEFWKKDDGSVTDDEAIELALDEILDGRGIADLINEGDTTLDITYNDTTLEFLGFHL